MTIILKKGRSGMKYRATLSGNQVIEFMDNFYSEEVSKAVEVKILPIGGGNFNITLRPMAGLGSELLEASFKDGPLYHWGWTDKFKRVR